MCARLGAGLDLLKFGSSPGDLLDDVLNRCRPDEGLGIFVAGFQELIDRPRQIRHTHEAAAPRRLVRQFSVPVLYQIQPARAGRNKVIDKARMLLQPSLHQRSQNNLAAQRHLLRGAVSALPLPKLRLLSRRQLARQTLVGHGTRHSKSQKRCLVIYRTLY